MRLWRGLSLKVNWIGAVVLRGGLVTALRRSFIFAWIARVAWARGGALRVNRVCMMVAS